MNRPLGWIIAVINKNDPDIGLLSYGEGDEPCKDELLIRGAATMFAFSSEAEEALRKSLLKQDEQGCTWHKKREFRILPIRRQP